MRHINIYISGAVYLVLYGLAVFVGLSITLGPLLLAATTNNPAWLIVYLIVLPYVVGAAATEVVRENT